MGIIVNRVIGVVLLAGYVFILLNKEQFAPALQVLDENKNLYPDAAQGYDYIIMLPILGCAFLIMPGAFVDLLSPRYGFFQDKLLTPGFFIIVGYFCLVVSWGLWALFV